MMKLLCSFVIARSEATKQSPAVWRRLLRFARNDSEGQCSALTRLAVERAIIGSTTTLVPTLTRL
jgi:hypothetical protein